MRRAVVGAPGNLLFSKTSPPSLTRGCVKKTVRQKLTDVMEMLSAASYFVTP
jgi:hypothetical protein